MDTTEAPSESEILKTFVPMHAWDRAKVSSALKFTHLAKNGHPFCETAYLKVSVFRRQVLLVFLQY